MAIPARISENLRYDTTLDRINNTKTELDNVNEMAVSGRKLKRISDDPASVVKVLRNRAGLANIEQFKKTIEFGRGFLTKTEDTLASIYDSLSRAKELAIQQANSTYDSFNRKAVAEEIKQILSHVTRLANTKYNNKFIFAGFQSNQPALSPDGNYIGDDGKIFVQVDEDSFHPINVSGRDIFDVKPGEENTRKPLIPTIQNLYDSLMNDDRPLLHQCMEDLDKCMDIVITSQASLGARRNALDDASERIEKNEVQLSQETSALESTDMVKSALDMKRAEHALQFTLQASTKMITPTLVDFLK